jgi:NADPH-dependent 2,4-dienoyl-CoA reductase/sulfur reductase-like enzyme
MGDTFALTASIDRIKPTTALIVGAGYVGLAMADWLTTRGISITQVEMLPEVLPTVDPELGALVLAELDRHGVEVHTRSTVTRILRAANGSGRLHIDGVGPEAEPLGWDVDLVLVVVGARTSVPEVPWRGRVDGNRPAPRGAAGDCVVTHHRLLGVTYLPLGTTAHKQGRVAGENALGGTARFAGCLGTQVVKVFDLVAARTGLREHEAVAAGYTPLTSQASPDDHKAYYPGAKPIHIRITGDAHTGRLLGAQLIGPKGTETAKRVDTYATALFHNMTVDGMSELDLSYTPPLGSPWDAVQMASQAWVRDHQPPAQRTALPAARVS